jgi:serine/threonine-protein kinase
LTGETTGTGIPERIGKYRVSRVLGRGSMGVVFLARDSLIDRDVAIKTVALPPGLDDDKVREFRERFLREARAAGRLSHPSIVTIYEADDGSNGGTPFIAMEFVEGLPWNLKIRQRTFPDPEQVLSLAREIASALEYAHKTGVVHRDIKPANIVQTPDGHVKLMDFGIAKVPTSELTREGQFLGTPAYMSPEQIMGRAVDGRSDLFSLGTVLYELLTCKKPFEGEDITTVTYAILKEDPRPARSISPTIPEEVDRILFHLMAKDVAQRYASARQLAEDIDAYMGGADLPHAGQAVIPWVESAHLASTPQAGPPSPPAPAPPPVQRPGPATPPPPGKVPVTLATQVQDPEPPPPPEAAPSPPRGAEVRQGGSGMRWVLGGLGLAAVVALGLLVAAIFWYQASAPSTGGDPESSTSASLESAAQPPSASAESTTTPPAPGPATLQAVPVAEAPKPRPKPRPVPPPAPAPPEPALAATPPQEKPPATSAVAYTFTTGTKRGEFWIRIDGQEVAHQVINRRGSIFSQASHTGSFAAPAGAHQVEFQIRTELQNINETHAEQVTFEAGHARTLGIVMTKFNKEIHFVWGP